MLAFFGFLGGFLSALCYLPYARDILLKKTHPERASWFIWSVLGSIAFFSQLNKGATDSLWLTGVQTFGVTSIFLLSLKYGVGGLTKKDLFALSCAAFGLFLWWVTTDAAYALMIVIGIDLIGALLTVHKAYLDPESETMSTWVLAGLAGGFAALAVGQWNPLLLAYPFYTCVLNTAVVLAMIFGNKKK